MVVGNIVPQSDNSIQWSVPSAGTHFDDIDEAPATQADYIQATESGGDDNDIDDFNFTTIDPIEEVTQVEIKVNGLIVGTGLDPEIDLYIEGAWKSVSVGWKNCGLTDVRGWHSIVYVGLSSNQASLDALRVRVRGDIPEKAGINTIHTIYCIITYTVAAVGYGHKFLGVPSASIGKVCGVPTANIRKIKGV